MRPRFVTQVKFSPEHGDGTSIASILTFSDFGHERWHLDITNPSQDHLKSDAQLVLRLRKREHASMGETYDRYGNIAYSVILRIVGHHHTAEDLTQETFLRVWTHVHLYDPDRGPLRSWIIVIARNKAIDYLRCSQGRNELRSFDDDRLEQCQFDASKHSWPADELWFSSVKAVLHKLTENQRKVLDLAYFQGMSQTEMAEALNQPLGTVKTWVRTALRVLRDELQTIQSPSGQPGCASQLRVARQSHV